MDRQAAKVLRISGSAVATASLVAPLRRGQRIRLLGFVASILPLVTAFHKPGRAVLALAAESEVYSYILIIPLIVAYLCFLKRNEIGAIDRSAWGLALLAAGIGTGALFLVAGRLSASLNWSESSQLALYTFSFLSFLVASELVFLGAKVLRAYAFPAFFLLFSTPLPLGLVSSLETASKLASAEAASIFFFIFRVPALREGTVFFLPGVVLEVAQECSGIRSSLVLFLTGLLAANLFLRTAWRRAVLVFVVLPLGVLRNGFRVAVIAELCIRYGPHMVHSPLHTRGGPLFFAISLIPFGLLLWWLYRGEMKVPAIHNP